MKDLKDFTKKHPWLVCVDSDGCVIDGMAIKHLECFGPGVIEIFGAEEHRQELLELWNKMNLYSMTRGFNRFKGLVAELDYMVEKGYVELDTSDLAEWVHATRELSNRSLEQWIKEVKPDSEMLHLALKWSRWVNDHIAMLPVEQRQPFSEAKISLEEAAEYADIAVVSSGNREAVEEEWTRNQILSLANIMMTQEYGSKEECLKMLMAAGYQPDQILMVGDSPGDIEAAKKAGVLYYPVLPTKENMSWVKFRSEIMELFRKGDYRGRKMEQCEREYIEYLTRADC